MTANSKNVVWWFLYGLSGCIIHAGGTCYNAISSDDFRNSGPGSVLADVFVPDGGIFFDVGGEQGYTFLKVEVENFDVERAEPIDAALESAAFADDDASESELADEAAAIPAGSEGSDHD